MKRREIELASEVDRWLKAAAAADAEEDKRYGDKRGDEMPAWVADKEKRLERIRAAKAALEAEKKGVVPEPESAAPYKPTEDPDRLVDPNVHHDFLTALHQGTIAAEDLGVRLAERLLVLLGEGSQAGHVGHDRHRTIRLGTGWGRVPLEGAPQHGQPVLAERPQDGIVAKSDEERGIAEMLDHVRVVLLDGHGELMDRGAVRRLGDVPRHLDAFRGLDLLDRLAHVGETRDIALGEVAAVGIDRDGAARTDRWCGPISSSPS